MPHKSKKYQKGGMMNGPSHDEGGIPIEVEGGEYIIKKDSVNASTEPILEEINKTGKLEYKNGGKIMPTVKDELGNTVASLPYNEAGDQMAEQLVQNNPNYKIDYGQNNITDAPGMREQMYAGGGKTGYNQIGVYEKGGKVKK